MENFIYFIIATPIRSKKLPILLFFFRPSVTAVSDHLRKLPTVFNSFPENTQKLLPSLD